MCSASPKAAARATSVYLRGFDDYEFHTLKLTAAKTTGVGHIGYRCRRARRRWSAASRRSERMARASAGTTATRATARAYRFRDPDDHVFEIYYETRQLRGAARGAAGAEEPARSAITAAASATRRLDHVNLLAVDVSAIRDFLPKALGSRVTEQIVLDNGTVGGCWFTVNNKTYDIAYSRDATGTMGRFHHVTYAVDQREHVLQAADIFLENSVFIETGPHKHAIQETFFLYVYEPAGNRVEVANAGARLILAPDWQTVTWTETERKKGQAWGLKTIESFHTHGTPPVSEGR